MTTRKTFAGKCIFGIDIGTRSIVGTVGFMNHDRFVVVGQKIIEHQTRAMLDGQIHDVAKVAATIREVKEALEEELSLKLTEVCIAAAGRVLKTLDVHVETTYEDETLITEEEIYALNSKGVETAYDEFMQQENSDVKFYCVGYSIVRYYLNGYPMIKLQDHKAKTVGADLIATFLPNDVVDGLYRAVEMAGLTVANLTLEPIAAILVAIPEQFRMLNIALVDVGAGTSDISITKDGSITAYGMIPVAGDSITEEIAKHCLTDFNTAEQIKRDYSDGKEICYQDIIGLPHTATEEEIAAVIRPAVEHLATLAAQKMKELNGDRSVSAVFVVGGGGKIDGYTERLAGELGIVKERVALRGKEVMSSIEFEDADAVQDSTMVTPIGICLSFFEQNNNFVYVYFNDEQVKLYDNGKLAVIDAAMNADIASEDLFPKRGRELEFTVNGKTRIVRGELGEAAIIMVNGEIADIHRPIREHDIIRVIPSTAGGDATMEISKLPEYVTKLEIEVNGKKVSLPGIVLVNGAIQSGYYQIQSQDVIEIQKFYTVSQILEFLDVKDVPVQNIYVNHALATADTKVYENFSMEIEMQETETQKTETDEDPETMQENPPAFHDEIIIVNREPITLHGKAEYIFVDVFDYINFDLTKPKGKGIVTKVNGQQAQYMDPIHDGDVIEIYWE